MENNRKKIILFVIVAVIFIVICVIMTRLASMDQEENTEMIDNSIQKEKTEEMEKVNVNGYHLVTYAQTANTNSFIKSVTVNAVKDGKVKFVIGNQLEDSTVEERTSFEVACKEGENTIDLLSERHLVKTGEYLLMDISGQDVLYFQKGTKTKSLVQSESNKRVGKMFLTESDYILPFEYTLEKVQEYNGLVIGNNITTKKGGAGSAATDVMHDYYYLTKTRLENTFEKVNMNRINAMEWETNKYVGNRKDWISKNLKQDIISNLDLVIFQLGDNYNQNDDLEKDVAEMVEYIKEYSPNAEMIWIGVWDKKEKILNDLPGICERLQIDFINISDLNTPNYQSLTKEMSENVDENNTSFETFNEVFYPNNEAMQIISNRIMERLKFDF